MPLPCNCVKSSSEVEFLRYYFSADLHFPQVGLHEVGARCVRGDARGRATGAGRCERAVQTATRTSTEVEGCANSLISLTRVTEKRLTSAETVNHVTNE